VLGRRNAATCKKLLAKIGVKGRTFLTDDWEVFHKLIPEDQLFTGKDLTFPIEQDNSDIRHYTARFRRRTKVVSRSEKMVDLTLRLHHYLDQPKNYAALAAIFLSIFN
jgi:insertion element IS1 protein InsB